MFQFISNIKQWKRSEIGEGHALITILTLPERFPVSGQHQGLSVISWNVAQGPPSPLRQFLDDIRFRTFQCHAAAGNNNLFLSKNKKILWKNCFSKKTKKCRRNSCLQGNGSWDVLPQVLTAMYFGIRHWTVYWHPSLWLTLSISLLSRNIFLISGRQKILGLISSPNIVTLSITKTFPLSLFLSEAMYYDENCDNFPNVFTSNFSGT